MTLIRLITLALGLLTPPALADGITLFAAASLRGALDAVIESYEGPEITVSYAGSGVIARQVIQGAPADIFISANIEWMDAAHDAGAVLDPIPLLSNRLVLIGHDPTALTLSDLPLRLGDSRLAVGLVQAVPAGIYAKAALEHLSLWDALAPQLAQTDNVRAALALVASGEAPYGIVYATDALAEPRVHVLADIPEGSHDPILYPLALTAQPSKAAGDFFEFLLGSHAMEIFAAHGFMPAEAAP